MPQESLPLATLKSNEEKSGKQRAKELLHRKRRYLGALAVAAVLTGAWSGMDKSESYEYHPAVVQENVVIDNDFRIASWNMHNCLCAVRLKRFAQRYNLDVIALQELDHDNYEKLRQRFPEWNTVYAMADRRQHLAQGGYGDVLMTKQKIPEDSIFKKGINGTSGMQTASGLVEGVITDIAHNVARQELSVEATKDGWQENRAIQAITTKVFDGEKLIDVRVINSHISGHETVRNNQFKELLRIVKDNTKKDRPTVFCGDLNALPEKVIPAFAQLGFITPETGYTSVKNPKTIDYCTFNEAEFTGVPHASAVKISGSDHYPVFASWEVGEP